MVRLPYPKLGHINAIPTPDGKILVLSSLAHFYGSGFDGLNEDFVGKSHPELYDPETNVWKLLPELCVRLKPFNISQRTPFVSLNFEVLDNSSGSWTTFANVAAISKYDVPMYHMYSIQECCFISESILLVRITSKYFRADGHLVMLNIHSSEQGWKSFEEWEFGKMYPGRFVKNMLVVGDRLFLDARGGIDISPKPPVNVKVPRSDYSEKMLHKMALTEYVEDRECCFANVFSDHDSFPGTAYLVVDEFKYDFTRGICTPKIKAPFSFITAERTDLFYIKNVFMLPPTPILFKEE